MTKLLTLPKNEEKEAYEILKVVAKCGLITESTGNEHFPMFEEHVHFLVENGWLSMKEATLNYRKTFVYYLTEKGEDFLFLENLYRKPFYRGYILEKDARLVEYYLSLPKEKQETWVTKDELLEKHPISGVPDGAYVNDDGEFVAIKILKKNANFSLIEKTENFLKEAEIPKIEYLMYEKP